MKTPLVRIEIPSIYKLHGERVLLPKRMAQCTPDTHAALTCIAAEVREAGGRLLLSDLFRSFDMQFQAHLDWKAGKKRAYSPPPGGSMHEAGRAFDLSLKDLRISLQDLWDIAGHWGVVPIIDSPNARKSEAWHFECRGSHAKVYEYYRHGEGGNMKPYRAMVHSAILANGEEVGRYGSRQQEAYLQFSLIRLGCLLGNVDGIVGRRTRDALMQIEADSDDLNGAVCKAEDLLQGQFPDEYGIRTVVEEELFDYEVPGYVGA